MQNNPEQKYVVRWEIKCFLPAANLHRQTHKIDQFVSFIYNFNIIILAHSEMQNMSSVLLTGNLFYHNRIADDSGPAIDNPRDCFQW